VARPIIRTVNPDSYRRRFARLWSSATLLRASVALAPVLFRGKGLRIVVGASGVFEWGWIPTDADYLSLLKPSDWDRFFAPDSIDAILAEHVWEHLTPEEGVQAAALCYRYLRPGGYLRVAIPDGFHPSPEYIEWVRVSGSGPGADDHKLLYTCETARKAFASVGFSVELLEYFDRDGEFHFTEWDPADGMVHRSSRYDARNAVQPLRYTSLILDAKKPDTRRPDAKESS
jgi:predicted SAM-dependent methyltransferase